MGRVWSATTARGRLTLALGLLLAAGGLLARYPVLAALGVVLVTIVGGDLLAVLRAPGLTVQRTVAPLVVVRHGACQGTLRVRGARPGSLARLEAFELVDGVPVDVPIASAGGAGVGASGREAAVTVTYAVPTPRRGLRQVGPTLLRRRGLAGMAARSDQLGGADQVRVLPRPTPLAGLPSGHRRAVVGGDDSAEIGGTDLVGLHEYAMGDDLRRLHWATSARTGTLMVREDAEPSEAHVLVLLDDHAGSYADARGSEGFEEAVELAAGLCRTCVEAGSPLRFLTTSGRHEVVIPGSATRQPRREARELEWLLAEIQTVEEVPAARTGTRDLDIAVAITGARADRHRLAAPLAGASVRVLAVVDPTPGAAVTDESGALVLAGRTALELGAAWDTGVRA